jgi:hypothetical protein
MSDDPTLPKLSMALNEDQWKHVNTGTLRLTVDHNGKCVVGDHTTTTGIGRSPAQALADLASP